MKKIIIGLAIGLIAFNSLKTQDPTDLADAQDAAITEDEKSKVRSHHFKEQNETIEKGVKKDGKNILGEPRKIPTTPMKPVSPIRPVIKTPQPISKT